MKNDKWKMTIDKWAFKQRCLVSALGLVPTLCKNGA
jgi:hypothetical protein